MNSISKMKEIGSNGSGNSGNTIRVPSSKRWCFTTKYVIGSTYLMKEVMFGEDIKCGIMSLEVGEGGYKHWQGYLEYKTKSRPFGKLKYTFTPDTHWEKAKGNRINNIKYITKDPFDGIIIKNNIHIPRPIFKWKYEMLYTWQKDIVNKYKDFAPPTNRSIDWYWEKTGNKGKSVLAKHLVDFEDAIVVSGKAKDIFFAIKTCVDERGDAPKIIILDIPRSMIDYISYQAIEKILDGLMFSGKYEGGMVRFNVPWVICLANTKPNLYEMSLDRWNIFDLSNDSRKPLNLFPSSCEEKAIQTLSLLASRLKNKR